MKEWPAHVCGKLRGLLQSVRTCGTDLYAVTGRGIAKGRDYLATNTVGALNWIARHRVWIWTFAAIVVYLLGSQYLFDLINAHYLRHPPEPGHFRIDNLSFWDRDTEGARNLIFALGGWLGVLAAIVGFVLAGFRTSTQMQMTQTAIDGQVTERFTRAVEQLGKEQRAVRLGAIYALERIARDSPRDRDTIVETLAAYIREHAPWPPRDKDSRALDEAALKAEKARTDVRPPIDISAALTVLCGLLPNGDPLRENVDLRHTDLRGLDAPNIDLSYTSLSRACMNRANLYKANLTKTSLVLVDLRGSILKEMCLKEADLRSAELGGADLDSADLSMANLRFAFLDSLASGEGTHLSNANLSDVKHLTQEQIDSIRYYRGHPPKNLPDGLTLPEPYDE